MPPIKHLLSNGDLAVIQEDGSHIVIDPEGKIVPQTPVGKIAAGVTEAAKVRPPIQTESSDFNPQNIVSGVMRNVAPSILPKIFTGAQPGLAEPPPVATLEKAGKAVSGAVGDVGRRLVKSSVGPGVSAPGEAARLIGGSAIQFLGAGGELSPSNIAANVGMHALVAPAAEGGMIRAPKFSADVPAALSQSMADFEAKMGRPAMPEEIGKIVRSGFEKGYAPQEAAAVAAAAAKTKGFGKAGEYVAGKFGPEPLTTQETGQAIKNEIGSSIQAKRMIVDQLYEQRAQKMGDAKASNTSDAASFIDKVFGEKGINYSQSEENIQKMFRDLGAKELTEKYSGQQLLEMQNTLEKARAGQFSTELDATKKSAYTKMVQVMNDLNNPNLMAKRQAQLTTEVGQYAYSGSLNDPIKAVYRQLYHHLRTDSQRTAEELGYSTVSGGARDFYKRFKDFQESDVVKAVENKDPSQLIDYAMKTPERTTRLMDALTPARQDTFRNGLLTKMQEGATDAQGTVQPKDIVKGINRYSDEQLKAAFGEKFPAVDAYRKYADTISKSDLFSEPAGAETAKLVRETAPSDLVNKIMARPVETLRQVTGNLNPEGQAALKRGVWDQIVRDSTSPDGKLDWGNLSGNINKFEQNKPGWLKELYGQKDYRVIVATQRIADAIDKNASTGFGLNLAKAAVYHNPLLRMYFAAKAMIPKLGPGLESQAADILTQEGPLAMSARFAPPPPSPSATLRNTVLRQGAVMTPLEIAAMVHARNNGR